MIKCQASECFCTDFNKKFCKHYREEDKPKSSGLRRTPMKRKRRPTGEMELFKELWEKRKHRCFVTGQPLEFSHMICFHILGKGAFPSYRLNPSNIIFVNAQYHMDWHTMSKEELLKKDARWVYVFKMYDLLKQAYLSEDL
jgi:hypothetical protein